MLKFIKQCLLCAQAQPLQLTLMLRTAENKASCSPMEQPIIRLSISYTKPANQNDEAHPTGSWSSGGHQNFSRSLVLITDTWSEIGSRFEEVVWCLAHFQKRRRKSALGFFHSRMYNLFCESKNQMLVVFLCTLFLSRLI
ncbi:hypothetical protein EGR_00321 [Echinococcus granulosus]|uniref:Uncharacterized protein n=1 Tax=Echinococcus granulosus TaxID=6210 RepID=W6V265_ECHGR|nr:hypothetical protein EGR_00321 [Echinococcus granulosus]EUB65052.1 hypothetical protein EGR_00321 [Echinococcus granulosus]